MSYDITIASDELYSRAVPLEPLRTFIAQIPRVQPNGTRGFVLRDGDRLWMEIDLESVTEDGDARDDSDESPTVNCLRLHIPYQFLGEHPVRDYYPVILTFARHLGWSAIDEQTGKALQSADSSTSGAPSTKPWWKFW
jgi:hypothetical protein